MVHSMGSIFLDHQTHPQRYCDNPFKLACGDADFWTMADLSLDELKALSAVAMHRSFRGAATELDMPPSSLSHLVAAVEKQLGVRLFNRTTRSVSVTEAGEAFLARVRPAWLEIVDAVETVNRFRSRPAGTVRINAYEEVLLRVLPIVVEFMTAYPEVKVDLITEGRLVDIVAEGFDAGLRHAESTWSPCLWALLRKPRLLPHRIIWRDEAFLTRLPTC
jgi:DNA-binding transcriptional LysR family regulator